MRSRNSTNEASLSFNERLMRKERKEQIEKQEKEAIELMNRKRQSQTRFRIDNNLLRNMTGRSISPMKLDTNRDYFNESPLKTERKKQKELSTKEIIESDRKRKE